MINTSRVVCFGLGTRHMAVLREVPSCPLFLSSLTCYLLEWLHTCLGRQNFDFPLVAMPFPSHGYETFSGPVLVVDQAWCTPAIVVHVFV